MKLALFDPSPFHNDYVSKMFFIPLEQFARNSGVMVKRIHEPVPEAGWTMLCNAGKLTHEIVRHFNDNGCKIAAVSCNDSAYLTANIDAFFHEIPLLFTVSGVQKVNFSKQSVMNPDMTVTTRDVPFLDYEAWECYNHMRENGRLLPLPYVPWDRLQEVPIPAQKTPKILFRGGNHFWRFVAYLHALKNGVAHPASGFLTEDYFREDMVPQFRYCEECRRQRAENSERLPFGTWIRKCECTEDLKFNEPLKWNNRSPKAFCGLAAQFRFNDGPYTKTETDAVEMALNFRRQNAEQHLRAVADAAFFADCKWEFSIHGAQRFWEAASVGTVNMLPERANDQEHFPHIADGFHYCTFSDDFSNIGEICAEALAPEVHSYVSKNAKGTYEHWIKPGPNYVTNENLLRKILSDIEGVCA